MTDKLDLVLDKIKDLKDSHGKRLDRIDDNLEDHMLRCDLLEKKDNAIIERVEVLELPGKALKFIKQSALWIAALTGVILAVIKIYNSIGA